MPTITTGRFFLARHNAVRADHGGPDGAFRLVLRVLDRIGQHATELYQVTWTGADAATWWRNHSDLAPGDELALSLINPRAMPGARAPETHATVTSCKRTRAIAAD